MLFISLKKVYDRNIVNKYLIYFTLCYDFYILIFIYFHIDILMNVVLCIVIIIANYIYLYIALFYVIPCTLLVSILTFCVFFFKFCKFW